MVLECQRGFPGDGEGPENLADFSSHQASSPCRERLNRTDPEKE